MGVSNNKFSWCVRPVGVMFCTVTTSALAPTTTIIIIIQKLMSGDRNYQNYRQELQKLLFQFSADSDSMHPQEFGACSSNVIVSVMLLPTLVQICCFYCFCCCCCQTLRDKFIAMNRLAAAYPQEAPGQVCAHSHAPPALIRKSIILRRQRAKLKFYNQRDCTPHRRALS